jgi:C_GCAxxG_C_C family probable redox protein
VFLAVSKATGKDGESISYIASGFQGGMGAGEACGAVSGGVMAISLLYGQDQPEAANQLAREFVRGFEDRNGAIRCIDLIGFDVASANTGEDIGSVKDLMLFFAKGGKRICNKAVSSSVELLLEQLEEWEN